MRVRNVFLLLVSGALAFGTVSADPAVPAAPIPIQNAPAPQHFRGTLSEYDGPFLTLTLQGRKTVTLGVTTQTRIVRNRSLALGDLQAGAWVGVAALKGADGKFRAQGIRLYPAAMQGQGEGLYPLDPANPARILINGSLTEVSPGGVGGTLTVAFHGTAGAAGDCAGHAAPGGVGCNGIAEVQFARGVPILSIEAGDSSSLLPGAFVSILAQPDASGALVASGITIERDAPPPKPAAP